MTRERLLLLLQVLRRAGASWTVYGVLGLYLVCTGAIGDDGVLFGPHGLLDIRVWINGRVVSMPAILATCFAGLALYGRGVAKGPRFAFFRAAAPEVAAVARAVAEEMAAPPAAEERPEPVVLRPVTAGLGLASTPAAAGLGGGRQSEGGNA
jgi:hypothetical protein